MTTSSLQPLLGSARGRWITFLAVILAAWATIHWWFNPWAPRVLYGDDLDYFVSYMSNACGTHFDTMLVSVCHERFRPFAFGVISTEIFFFDRNLRFYFALNALIQVFLGIATFFVALRLSRNPVVAICFALAIFFSRFATYQVTQVIGPIESLASLFAILSIYSIISAEQTPESICRPALAIFFSALAILSHERYAVLSIWLALAIAISPGSGYKRVGRRILLVVGSLSVPIVYILYKQIALDTPFLIGTGGTHLSFDFNQIIHFGSEAILSILGFNSGDDYLVGISLLEAPVGFTFALGAIFCLALIFSCMFGLIRVFSLERWKGLRWPLLLILLAGLLLGPGLLTIRLEQRWIFMPFALLLLCVSYFLGVCPKIFGMVASIVIAATSIGLDHQIMVYYGRLFFVSSPRFAAMVERDIVGATARYRPLGRRLAFVAETSQCRWSLLNGEFFWIYEGVRRQVDCFGSLDAAVESKIPVGTPIFTESGGRLIEISSDYQSAFKLEYSGIIKYDFVKKYSEGRISSLRPVDTPTHRGVMMLPWRTVVGPRETITVLSGFSYRFASIPILEGEHLAFGVGMVFNAPQHARAVISVESDHGATSVIYASDLDTPSQTTDIKIVKPVDIDLSEYQGQNVAITFSVESPGGDSSSHWVAFASPRLLLEK